MVFLLILAEESAPVVSLTSAQSIFTLELLREDRQWTVLCSKLLGVWSGSF